MVRGLLRGLLEAYGYEVLLASSEVEALDRWSQHSHELVAAVVDWTLPDGTGAGVAFALRRNAPSLPLILTLGDPASWDEVRAELSGTLVFLNKPFGASDFREALVSCGL